ncbi:MAG: NnrS family protein, partial [Bdellovibrionales bacterium]|nr:NnrS family protein [Bdellovibrionales bacterium]
MSKNSFSKVLITLGFIIGIFYPKFLTIFLNDRLDFKGLFFSIYQWHSHEMIYGFFGVIFFALFYSPLFEKPKPPERIIGLFFIFLFIIERFSMLAPFENFYVPLLFGLNFWLFSLLFLAFNYSSMQSDQKKIFWLYACLIICKVLFLSFVFVQAFSWINKIQLISLEIIRLSVFFIIPIIMRKENQINEEERPQKLITYISVIPSILVILSILLDQEENIIAMIYVLMISIHLIRAFGIIEFNKMLTFKNGVLLSAYDFALLGPVLYIISCFYPQVSEGRSIIHSLTTGSIGILSLSLFYIYYIKITRKHNIWFGACYTLIILGSLL